LSGGEAQRVALARAFAVAPRLLFLDEPFSSLDPTTRAELVGELRALLREEDVTAVFVTHDLTEVRLIADRALVLDGGDVIQHGSVEQLFARPAGARVAEFLGYAVVRASVLPPDIVDAAGVSAGARVAVRPSAVLVTNPGDEVPGSRVAPATVAAVQGAHGRARLLLDLDGGRIAAELGVQEALDRHVGDQVRVTIDPAGVIPL
jgi:ABC-type sulfate/molybdate transport systems ATPase subunit